MMPTLLYLAGVVLPIAILILVLVPVLIVVGGVLKDFWNR